MKLIEVAEQDAVFEDEPDFEVSLSACINLLNHKAMGGTNRDLQQARHDFPDAKRYTVRLMLYIEEK